MEAGESCPKCGIQLDGLGIHPQSCMAEGDATLEHSGVQDIFEDYSRRGGLRPKREAPWLLREDATATSGERPADLLVIPQLALARALPDGSRAVRTERVCFDFAVVNALGPSHWAQTSSGSGSAAEAYDAGKRQRRQTEARCREQGLTFWPVVFEQQGGRSKAAQAAIRAIAEAIAMREGCEAKTVQRAMEDRLAVLLARGTATMIARRQRSPAEPQRQAWERAIAAAEALS